MLAYFLSLYPTHFWPQEYPSVLSKNHPFRAANCSFPNLAQTSHWYTTVFHPMQPIMCSFLKYLVLAALVVLQMFVYTYNHQIIMLWRVGPNLKFRCPTSQLMAVCIQTNELHIIQLFMQRAIVCLSHSISLWLCKLSFIKLGKM